MPYIVYVFVPSAQMGISMSVDETFRWMHPDMDFPYTSRFSMLDKAIRSSARDIFPVHTHTATQCREWTFSRFCWRYTTYRSTTSSGRWSTLNLWRFPSSQLWRLHFGLLALMARYQTDQSARHPKSMWQNSLPPTQTGRIDGMAKFLRGFDKFV